MHWSASTAAYTEAFGARLAQTRPACADLQVIHLIGELGAGKTTLVRGWLRECGFSGVVRSPTYTLSEVYALGPITYLHLDLYRLGDPDELANLGLRDWAMPNHCWLIEWPERAGSQLPPPDLAVALSAAPAEHRIEVTARSAAGRGWLSRLAALLPPQL